MKHNSNRGHFSRRAVTGSALAAGALFTIAPRAFAQQANISVGTGPVLAVAALQLAMAKGYFTEEGLNTTPAPVSSGAATLAALIGGSLQFAATNVTSVAIARSKGIKIKIVAQQSAGSVDPSKAFDGILIAANSPIASAKDLAGKTIAVNAVNSIGTLATSRAIEKAGGDIKTVKWVELNQGDSLAALQTGRIDAAYIIEPFITIGEGRGLRSLLSPYTAADPNFAESVIVASDGYLTSNPEIGRKFKRAIDKALKLASEQPEEVRKILPTYIMIAPDLLPKIRLPSFPTAINVQSIRDQIELAAKYGYTDAPVFVDDLIWRP
jgi:NitT/TauT family transport system substrate-binding protein